MISIGLAWDSGVSDGNPGEGRIRVNAANILNATHVLVNALDRHEAVLAELIPTFKAGDVLALTRDGTGGHVVAWVMGDIVHAGGYYKIPVKVRSVEGGFAAHDLVELHRMDEHAIATPQAAPQVLLAAPVESAPQIQQQPAGIHMDDARAISQGIIELSSALQQALHRIHDQEQRIANLEAVLGAIGVHAKAVAGEAA